MLCAKCDKDIPDDAIYCCYCGKKLIASPKATKKRGNGQGTVYKTPAGTWAAEVTLGYYIDDNGKRKRKIARKQGFKTKKSALEHINALFCTPEKTKVITLSELWELFQSDLNALSASKRTAYNIAWRKIKDEVAYRTIDSFSVPELQELIDTTAPSYYTRRDIKTLLSHLYKIAIRDDYIDKNRTEYIKLPKLVTTEREIFKPEEIQALWLDYRAEPSQITAGMLVMLYTGIRAGELLTILCENVHLEAHYMTGGIKTAKGKNRKIIIPDKIVPVMQYLIDNSLNGKICARHPDNFYEDWREKRKALQLREELTPYCCRHTYITNLTALKVSPAMLQELAGHEDYDTTLVYTHLSVEDRLKEVNKL